MRLLQRFFSAHDTSRSIPGALGLVIDGGYCIGCGACTRGMPASPLVMKLDEFGRYRAFPKPNTSLTLPPDASLCPFSDTSADEDAIAEPLFSEAAGKKDTELGYYIESWAGYVAEGEFRARGSSGGFLSWLLVELLRQRAVDAVIHVKPRIPDYADHRLFSFGVSRTPDEILTGAKSHYYPVEMSEMLDVIRSQPGRYALALLPCFVKAVRLLAREDPILRDRIKYCVGLVCGHLKSTAFAELLAWQSGVAPDQIHRIDFRRKLPEHPAWRYGVTINADSAPSDERTVVAAELFGTEWGLGFFKYKACDLCDDVIGETADISVGDAWLPEYWDDYLGTNVVVVRNVFLAEIVKKAITAKRLSFERIPADRVKESQSGGFRHRRDGLAYRLFLADRARTWRPRKRVLPRRRHLDAARRGVYEQRSILAELSHIAWKDAKMAADFGVFVKRMQPVIESYTRFFNASPPSISGPLFRLRAFLGRAKRRVKGLLFLR